MVDGQVENSSDESLANRTLATLILCGEIGLDEHIKMGIVRSISKYCSLMEKEVISIMKYDFIPHCDHVKDWLNGIK